MCGSFPALFRCFIFDIVFTPKFPALFRFTISAPICDHAFFAMSMSSAGLGAIPEKIVERLFRFACGASFDRNNFRHGSDSFIIRVCLELRQHPLPRLAFNG